VSLSRGSLSQVQEAKRSWCLLRGASVTSHEVGSREVLYAERRAVYWVHRPARVLDLFPCPDCRLTFDRSPEAVRPGFILLARLLYRVPSLHLRPAPFRGRDACQGFGPLRDITTHVHSPRGFPTPRYVPSPGSLNLSTGSSARGFAGLFHPAAVFRAVSRSGASHHRAATASFSEASTPSPLMAARSPNKVRRPRTDSPRPRGLDPRGAAFRRSGG